MAKQIASIEWRGDIPDIYCPVCGNPIYAIEKEFEICKHVVFTYPQDVGEFDIISPTAEPIIEKLQKKSEEYDGQEDDPFFDDPVGTVMKALKSKSILCFWLTTSGVGHGFSSSSLAVAVEFDPKKWKE